MRLLITRPEPDAGRLARTLEADGHAVLVEPMLSISNRDTPPLDLSQVQAILLTSANGVRALAANTAERGVPVLCVGQATAEAARALGFASVKSADGDVATLADAAMGACSPEAGTLLHVAGSTVAGDLSGRLESAGYSVRREVLYDADVAPSLSPRTRSAIKEGKIDAVLLYSPRSAARFAELVRGASLDEACRNIDALCLSRAVGDALGALSLRRILVAPRPEQDALLDLIGAELADR